jgi:hypothetical protein
MIFFATLEDIEKLLNHIKLCDSVGQATPFFKELEKIQGDLARMAFVENIKL